MPHNIVEYIGIDFCRSHTNPRELKVLRQFTVTLDCPTPPKDSIQYDRNHEITRARLWGTNAAQLKKLANQIFA